MKILMISDMHIRASAPDGRTDDYRLAQVRKLSYLFKVAEEEEVECIIQAGDMWNEPSPPLQLIGEVARMLIDHSGITFCTIYGQHDMYMRSEDRSRTATGLLESLSLVTVLSEAGSEVGDVDIHGISFGGSYEEACKAAEEDHEIYDVPKILVVHDMIGTDPLFPGHELIMPNKLLDELAPFDVVLTGDYHYPFFVQVDSGRTILNTGCMMRMTRLDRDMKRAPHFYIYDTHEKTFDKRKFPCRPWQNVFDLTEKTHPVDNTSLLEFIESLRATDKMGISFLDNLNHFIEANNVDNDVRALIMEVINE